MIIEIRCAGGYAKNPTRYELVFYGSATLPDPLQAALDRRDLDTEAELIEKNIAHARLTRTFSAHLSRAYKQMAKDVGHAWPAMAELLASIAVAPTDTAFARAQFSSQLTNPYGAGYNEIQANPEAFYETLNAAITGAADLALIMAKDDIDRRRGDERKKKAATYLQEREARAARKKGEARAARRARLAMKAHRSPPPALPATLSQAKLSDMRSAVRGAANLLLDECDNTSDEVAFSGGEIDALTSVTAWAPVASMAIGELRGVLGELDGGVDGVPFGSTLAAFVRDERELAERSGSSFDTHRQDELKTIRSSARNGIDAWARAIADCRRLAIITESVAKAAINTDEPMGVRVREMIQRDRDILERVAA